MSFINNANVIDLELINWVSDESINSFNLFSKKKKT